MLNKDFYSKVVQHQNQFQLNHPFGSFCPKKNELSPENISERINKSIINRLRDIIHKQVPLDVAFCEIYALFCYATRDLNELFPDFVKKTFIGYHKLLFHFIIFGCCLGKEYVKYIALNKYKMDDDDYKNNCALRYCIDTFLANINKSNMKYKYCNSQRMQIIKTLKMNYDLNDDIIYLINEFTAFHFEEFLMTLPAVKPLWGYSNDNVACQTVQHQLCVFFREYCETCMNIMLILPRFLLTTSFMCSNVRNDDLFDNLQYFANVMQFDLLTFREMESLPLFIRHIYGMPHLTHKPWTHTNTFIELFEMLTSHKNFKDECSIMDLFEKCIDIDSPRMPPLSIFYNGNIEGKMIKEKEMELFYRNIDVLFDEFLIKYFMSNLVIMNNIFYQLINALIYFLQFNIDNTGLKERVIDKLKYVIKKHTVPHIDYTQFMKTSKYKQSFENLKQIESFNTNLFDGKAKQSNKRTLNQVHGITNESNPLLKRIKLQSNE